MILDAQPVNALNDSDDTQQCGNCAHLSNCSQTLLDMNKVEEAAVCMHYKEIRVGKEKETLLLERVRETEDIIESVAEAFFAADRNWILTYVNRAAEQLYNIKREDVLHRCVWEVFPKVPGSVFHEQYLRAVRENSDWYLFCPNDIKKAGLKPLQECYGDEYEEVYSNAVSMGLGKKVKAQDIWTKVIESQVETGVPYLCSKDNANKKTNHQNIGVIKQSNLCNEIYQYTDEDTTAICTLSSMVLKNFIKSGKFDFELLFTEVRKVVRSLNKVVEINNYSTEKGRKGGLEQRAIAIGTQGLADVFYLMDYIFTSEEARKLNKDIFETIYYAAIYESNQLCIDGKYTAYDFFNGSPMSQGIFQFDMWDIDETQLSGMWDWDKLKENVKSHGVCNSLFTAQMPVASSAKITGSYEMTEPAHSAIFNRRVVGGEIMIVNKYLINDFEKIGIWCEDLKNEIIFNEGSIQNINFNNYLDPEDKNYNKKVKRIEHLIPKYKTIWEISQKQLIDMAADRAPFIDQSQSMNIYMSNPTLSKITSSHFHSWDSGLKTLCYYVRTKAISTGAKHLAMDISKKERPKATPEPPKVDYSNLNLPPRPENSDFECFGCSS
jgi:ribonucleoside-diphosphate reductase alpha chain